MTVWEWALAESDRPVDLLRQLTGIRVSIFVPAPDSTRIPRRSDCQDEQR